MTFRFARHTNQLKALSEFYCRILNFEILGHFKNHKGYDGVFLGKPGMDWHVEFTQNKDQAQHTFDEDDLLVFYPENRKAYDSILNQIETNNIKILKPKNPYWELYGTLIQDPDGYNIIISNQKINRLA